MPLVDIGGQTVEFPDSLTGDALNEAVRMAAGQLAMRPTAPPEMSFSQKVLAGAKRVAHGAMDLPTGINQMAANVLPEGAKPAVNIAGRVADMLPGVGLISRMVGNIPSAEDANKNVTAREDEYQKARAAADSTGFDFARTGGQVLSSAPLLAIPGANTFMGAAGIGAATGAGMSALTPVPGAGDNYAMEVAKNAAMGGAAGLVGGVAGKALGSVIAPRIDPNVRVLGDAGVELTPGQIAGAGFKRAESGATSIPVVGTGVINAQKRSIESFNRATANEVLKPLDVTVPKDMPAGRALFNHVNDAVTKQYDTTLAKVKPFGLDTQFAEDFAKATQNNLLLTNQRETFSAVWKQKIAPRITAGEKIDGPLAQEISSIYKQYSRTLSKSQEVENQELGRAFRDVANAFDDLVARTNPALAADIKAANSSFARMIRMEAASSMGGAKEGVFSPSNLASAVSRSDMSPRGKAVAKGTALMQNLSDPANAVLPPAIPDSGSGFRIALNTGLASAAGLGAGAVDPLYGAMVAGTLGAGRVAYSEPATRAFRAAMLAKRPELVGLLGEGVRRGGQMSGVPLGGLLRQGM